MLTLPVFDLMCTIRKKSDRGPVLSPVTQIYAVLIKKSGKLDKDGKKSQRNYEYIVNWSIQQLEFNEVIPGELTCRNNIT